MTPVEASLKVAQLDLAGSGMSDFAPDVGGLVSFEGTGSSDGRIMQVVGKLKAEKLKLAKKGTPATRPVELDFAAQHDLRKHSGTLRQGDIHIGAALAHLTGTYAEQGESVMLNMTLAGPNMPVPELETLLPALGVVLPSGSRLEGGTASAMLRMEGPADKLVTSGSLALNETRLMGFDLPKKMATLGHQRRAGHGDQDAERQRARGAGRGQRAGHQAAGALDRRRDRRRHCEPRERAGFQDERNGTNVGSAGDSGEHTDSLHGAGDVRGSPLPAGFEGVRQRKGKERRRRIGEGGWGIDERSAGREEEVRASSLYTPVSARLGRARSPAG
jgi:hypothetical protein